MRNELRIIGGKWRGRKLKFPDVLNLRPTTDRVRETLFNWLMRDVIDARCLDLFAGSGMLGFEALSRGAQEVVSVDYAAAAVAQIKTNSEILQCQHQIHCFQMKAQDFLHQSEIGYDIIFLDPPYDLNFIDELCKLIMKKGLLNPDGLIYFEMRAEQFADFNPPHALEIRKHKQAGGLVFGLLVNT